MDGASVDTLCLALNWRGEAYRTLPVPELDKAVADFTQVIGLDDAPTDRMAYALIGRGIVSGLYLDPPEFESEVADYTSVIEMDGVSTGYRVKALMNRGGSYGRYDPPQIDLAVADYTTIIHMAEVPELERIAALAFIGVTYHFLDTPDPDGEIAAYTALIDPPRRGAGVGPQEVCEPRPANRAQSRHAPSIAHPRDS